MIVRSGFVANSSSASYIVSGDTYKTTYELAEKMIKCRDWEQDDELIQTMKDKVDKCNHDPRDNVTFNTCNYETFILWIPERHIYVIQTCTNHMFDLDTMHVPPDELNIDGINTYSDLEYKLGRSKWYWDIENDLMIKDNKDYETCSKPGAHYTYKVYVNGNEDELKCPVCFAKEHPEQTRSALHAAELIERRKEAKRLRRTINLRG